jgi:outer membrane protein
MAEPGQPQIQASKTRVLAAEKGISVAKSGFYPNLSFQAGLFTNYSSIAKKVVQGAPLQSPVVVPIPDLVVRDGSGNQVPFTVNQLITSGRSTVENLGFGDQFDNNLRKGFTFNLNIPLFNGFQNKFAVENAKISRINAVLQLEQQKNQLRQTIETAVANEKAARKRLAAVEKQLIALEEGYRSSEQRFNLGVLNTVEFLMAKNNYFRAQNDKARFKYDFFIRRALLDFYLGKELKFN